MPQSNVVQTPNYTDVHMVPIEDNSGDIFDVHFFCSDFCARENEHYAGWYVGIVEYYDTPPVCESCGEKIA